MNNKKITVNFSSMDLITIVFICLKLGGAINWSWWIVLLPSIISWGFLVLFLIIGMMIVFIAEYLK